MDQPHLERRYDAERIAARVAEVAGALDREFRDGSLVAISILKGAAFFLADLVRRMSAPVRCEYIHVRREEGSDEILQIDFSTGFDVSGRPVLLVKDVVNTAVIEGYLTDQLESAGASLVRLAAIIDKANERKMERTVHFPLFQAERGRFVGYGMEYRGRYGQLPDIAELVGHGELPQ